MEYKGKELLLISACLFGLCTAYDGKDRKLGKLELLLDRYILVPACPEQLGGLSTPRTSAEIEQNRSGKDVIEGKARVITKDGRDVTQNFVMGAKQTLLICKTLGIRKALLKERSPSCGVNYIYDGTFNGRIKSGEGVTTALLKQHSIEVFSEEEIEKLL